MAKQASSRKNRSNREEKLAAAKSNTRCVSTYERVARELGFSCIAGVDEVGRGCLFGPVFAAAVVLDPERPIRGLCDSKMIDAAERSRLDVQIKRHCRAWAVGAADVLEIDQINIYQASRLAMKRALEALPVQPDYLLIDALRLDHPAEQLPLIGGDARCRAIAAASIVAKVHRDNCMAAWHSVFPEYNLISNKGYSTPDHRRALRKHGPTLLHRWSFSPVRNSSTNVFWTGYLNQPPPQEQLLLLETAG